ncbi:MAG: ubiquinone/menaquinone biosynthesis methyltransferase [Verrucomicrobiae bacterium]|nr:ubiquinone/menaquinone biosynthesis methyltransferase [Verrucomicrobiae bacterium]MDW8310446.1 ubiquinone/menaquinone biosynthesis methyltransferase [Verrucomicrobiales bacterium]
MVGYRVPAVDVSGRSVNRLFGDIAHRYDLLNDVQSLGLHRRWKRRVALLAAVQPGERALDVCCGTGDLAFALAARQARVVGLDFNPTMLQSARRRAQRWAANRPGGHAGPNPVFVLGDALSVPFSDATFDVVTVGYGLRNLTDWRAGLREMARVARPGGRILVLDFGKPAWPPWRALYFAYLKLLVPVLGWAFAGNAAAYAYILESLRQYPAQEGVAAAMRELGLDPVRVENLLGGAMSIHRGVKPG